MVSERKSSLLGKAWILAKQFMDILDIDKKLQIVLGKEQFAEVRVVRQGDLIPDGETKDALLEDKFDTIRIILNGEIPILGKLPEWIRELQFIETIFHELLHVKHPEWDEERIRDFSAEFIGKFLNR